jgi:tRNA nucleotidyltransferase/poly(A) polymerase
MVSREVNVEAFENHIQWTSVKEVTERLRAAGFEAYLAGGCVRDLIMNREPNDFDIATNAKPDEIEGLFPKSIAVGKAFGVIILPFTGYQLEVATFREDLEYRDGRRPEGVKFSTPEADAKRRDFTINALFYDLEKKQVIDFVGGRADIARRLIQTVGEPDRRFDEDKLRLLRAVRFAGQLDFEIEAQTLVVINKRAKDVASVSRERIRDEIQKLLKAPKRRRGLELLNSTGLLAVLFPEIAGKVGFDFDDWLNQFDLQLAPFDAELSWALFLLPAIESMSEARVAKDYLQKSLKLETRLIESLLSAIRHLPQLLRPEQVRLGELALILAKSRLAEPLAQIVAESRGIIRDMTALRYVQTQIFGLDGQMPAPWIAGSDLLQLGLKPGPKIGQIVNEAYLLQLEAKFQNRDEALRWCRQQ